jgi:hypothetical protein
MSRRARLVVLFVAIVAAVVVFGVSRLDGDWLRGKIVDIGRDKLGADIQIQTVKFSPLKGEAELAGVELDCETGGSIVHARMDAVRVKVRLWPLLLRKVRVERFEAIRPEISWTVLSGSVLNQMPGPIADRLRRRAARPPPAPKTKIDFTVDELVLRDGKVELNWLGDRPPFSALAANLSYSARNVSFDSFASIVGGADVSADIDLGGMPAMLRKQGAETTMPHFFLTGINLAYIDRLFDQTDALVLSGGTLNLHYARAGGHKIDVAAIVFGLELGENPGAPNQRIAMLPVERVRQIVDKRRGNFDLSFTMNELDLDASGDLTALVNAVWAGLQANLVKSTAAAALKDLR